MRDRMPVVRSLAEDHATDEPFAGLTVAAASHLEPSTGVYLEALHEAGAEVLFTGSSPESVHDDVVAALDARDGMRAFVPDPDDRTAAALEASQRALLREGPDLVLGDGAQLVARLHADDDLDPSGVRGGAEQTTSGVTRLEAMADEGVLSVPVYAVNHTPVKRHFDNVHGTGESALANLMIQTNAIVSGTTVVVAGYGYVGRGIARKARAIGAHTHVVETDPRKALEAHVDGHRVAPMAEAAAEGEVFVTATGNCEVLRREHFERMADGAVLCNAGHWAVEIDVAALRDLASDIEDLGDGITRHHLPDGRRLDLLDGGELVNLSGPYSQGHPAAVMDTTFGAMFVAGVAMAGDDRPAPGVVPLPDRLDREVARRRLDALDVKTEPMTDRQERYLDSWRHEDWG